MNNEENLPFRLGRLARVTAIYLYKSLTFVAIYVGVLKDQVAPYVDQGAENICGLAVNITRFMCQQSENGDETRL
jgi:hypothetical protein